MKRNRNAITNDANHWLRCQFCPCVSCIRDPGLHMVYTIMKNRYLKSHLKSHLEITFLNLQNDQSNECFLLLFCSLQQAIEFKTRGLKVIKRLYCNPAPKPTHTPHPRLSFTTSNNPGIYTCIKMEKRSIKQSWNCFL